MFCGAPRMAAMIDSAAVFRERGSFGVRRFTTRSMSRIQGESR